MKNSMLPTTDTMQKTLRNYGGNHFVIDIFDRTIVHVKRLIADTQLLGEKFERETVSPIDMALQAGKRDHQKVIDNYNKAKQQRAAQEATAA
jgi:hypothetical protein